MNRLIVSLLLILLILFLVLLTLASYVRAEACLTIDVPPQAVIHQPDGDTFHVFTFGPGGTVKIRVQGIDAPEKHEPGFAEAKEFTRMWLNKGPFIVYTCGRHTLDRIVGIVYREDGTLAQALKEAGHSKKPAPPAP